MQTEGHLAHRAPHSRNEDAVARMRCLLVLSTILLWPTPPVEAQNQPQRGGFWASVQPGYGSIARSSDQEQHERQAGFTLAFKLGATANRHVRVGAELNGWLLEWYSLNDPDKGESVAQILAIAQAYPWANRGLFLKAGAGRATYTTNDPDEFGSGGWGGTLGVGCDFRVANKISVTPAVNYSRGTLGDVANPLASIRNRRYSAVDFGVAMTYR